MKDKLRITESIAIHQATRHAGATGHRARVRGVADTWDVAVTNEGVAEAASHAALSADD